jgi:hypothetical protein
MIQMIHLIGADHFRAQRKKRGLEPTEIQRYYQSVVESAIHSIHPDLLAEEDHPSYLSEDGAESLLLPIAQSHGIRHLYVEADRATQRKLGYKTVDVIKELLIARGDLSAHAASAHKIAHQFPIRERFWLAEIDKAVAGKVLLVFGDLHLATFTGLLASGGIPYSIFAERVGVDTANDPEYAALKYAEDNNMFGQTNCFCLKN